ncbi:uncharacterized protein GJ701_016378 isoform 1-T1 [Geothlypis trichas]
MRRTGKRKKKKDINAAPARRYGGSWSNTASLRRVRRPGRAMLQTGPRCRPLRNRSRYAHSARCEAAQGQARSPATSPAGAAPAGLRPLPWAAVPARPRAPPGTPARVLPARPGPALRGAAAAPSLPPLPPRPAGAHPHRALGSACLWFLLLSSTLRYRPELLVYF